MIGGRSALLSAAGGGSPYGNWTGNYSDVSLLVRGGVEGQLLVPIDESPSPKDITVFGRPNMNTTLFKYGDSALDFPGSVNYYSISGINNFTPGLGAWTVEAWLYPKSATDWVIMSGSNFYVRRSAGIVEVGGAGLDPIRIASAPAVNQWTHVAAVRDSTETLRLFYNGIQQVSVNRALDWGATTGILIGGKTGSNPTFTDALLDDVRVTVGVGRYTSNFTPPAAELPANATDDPSYNSVSLLLRNSGPNSVSILVPADEGPTPKAITAFGNAGISTTTFKYGGSALVAGTSPNYTWGANRIQVPAGPAFAYGTGDFTVEAWIYPTLFSNGLFWSQTVSGTNYFMCQIGVDGRPYFVFAEIGGGTFVSGPVISLNEWSHVAIVRRAGQVTVYSNGVGGTALSCTQNFSNTTFIPTIGGYTHNTSQLPFSGLIDDLRITKGVARYTKNFLPPPAELPAI